jgi:hypothetical protein
MVFAKGHTTRIISRLEWYYLASLSSNDYTVNNQALWIIGRSSHNGIK